MYSKACVIVGFSPDLARHFQDFPQLLNLTMNLDLELFLYSSVASAFLLYFLSPLEVLVNKAPNDHPLILLLKDTCSDNLLQCVLDFHQ